MSSHQPAFQFYPADWRKDAELQMCSFATQGIWINMLCVMWESTARGELAGTVTNFCRLLGCTEAEFSMFLDENNEHSFADVIVTRDENVTQRDLIVTIKNRRMVRDERARQQSRESSQRHRERQRDGEVNPPSSSSSSSSTSVKEEDSLRSSSFTPVAEASAPPPMQEPEPLPRIPKVTFDYRSGRFENVTPELVQRWTEAYPAIDVGVEIAKAGEWAAANPKNRKANWQRFLINWFARAQEKARASPQTGSGKWGRLELS